MSPPSTQRRLIDHLGEWDATQIAELLRRRPDLARPAPADRAELAQRAQHQPSVAAAIARATLAENRLLQVVVCLRPSVPDGELVRALPEGVTLAQIEPVLTELEGSALVWRHDGRVHCSGVLRQCMPTGLGPPVHHFERALTVAHLTHAIGCLRPLLEHAPQPGSRPPPAPPASGRAPLKADLLEELSALLSVDGAAAAISAAAPPAVADLLAELAGGVSWTPVGHSMWFSPRTQSAYYASDPTYWLFERALLLPEGDGVGAVPRELSLSWRGGRPVADLALVEPVLVTRPVAVVTIDVAGATQIAGLLDQAAEVLDGWQAEPAKALKSGGLGVTALRAVATQLDLGVDDATRLVELLHLGGLLEATTTTTKVRRTYTQDTTIGPSAAAADWLVQPVPTRWRQLAGAWLRAARWPSLAGPQADGAKPVPALLPQYQEAAEAMALRSTVMEALAAQPVGAAVDPTALGARLYWHAPQTWLRGSPVLPEHAFTAILAEAESLGVTADGALTTFGRALWAGGAKSINAAEAALAAALPAPATQFTLQADLTAVVVGRLARDVAVELRLLADVESTGAATTFRFSEASLRRGLDAGRDAATITAFLAAHAKKGVPKPLGYLVADVERRHGHLQVGAAKAFVTSEDPAMLADAVSHRRTRKLGLVLLAPTVAVSTEPVAKVLPTLRAVGFLPVPHGEDRATITLTVADEPPPPSPVPARASPGDLPEPCRWRPARARAVAADQAEAGAVTAAEAKRLAAAIVAAGRGKGRPFR